MTVVANERVVAANKVTPPPTATAEDVEKARKHYTTIRKAGR